MLLFIFMCLFNFAKADTELSQEELRDLAKIHSPWVEGDVLYIKGAIDTHIYDYLSREAKNLKDIKVVDLNSFGGLDGWGLEIAKYLKSMGKITRVSQGHVCASACMYLFAAGAQRQVSTDTFLMIHGARLGPHYSTTFDGLCPFGDDGLNLDKASSDCRAFISDWADKAKLLTNQGFDFFESNGIAPTLRSDYWAMPDDPQWYEEKNVLRKSDWHIPAEEAIRYGLVTEILADK